MDQDDHRTANLDVLLGRAWPDGLPEREIRALAGLDAGRRSKLALRLKVAMEADAAGRVSAAEVEDAAGRAGLGKAMTYRLVRRWRDDRSLSSLLPHAGGRRRSTSASALPDEVRSTTEVAIAKALRRGGRQEDVLRRAAAELGPSAPSRTTMVRILRDLRASRSTATTESGFVLDVAGTAFALRTDAAERWRIHLCLFVDMATGAIAGGRPCSPDDILLAQAALLREVASLDPTEPSDDVESVRWIAPATQASGPHETLSGRAIHAVGAERLRLAGAAVGDVISTDGYRLGGASASRLGNRIDDLALHPRRTGAARGARFDAEDPEPLRLTLDQAAELFSAAVARHNARLMSAGMLSKRLRAAGAAARRFLADADAHEASARRAAR